MGDSNVRFTVITLLQFIDPIGMKNGWESRWNSSENGFPHLTFIDVVLKNGQIIYSSTTKRFEGLPFNEHREIFRVTFLWSPLSTNIVPVIKDFSKYLDHGSMELFIYVSIGLWDVTFTESVPKSKGEIDHMMESYCNHTISNLFSDFCQKNKILCVVGTMPDFGKLHDSVLGHATKSQFNFCSIHACNLLNKSVVLYDQRIITKSLKSEENGKHFSHIYGVISYLSIFQVFREMFQPDTNYPIRSPSFQRILFNDSCRRFPHMTLRNDWVGQFCQYDLV